MPARNHTGVSRRGRRALLGIALAASIVQPAGAWAQGVVTPTTDTVRTKPGRPLFTYKDVLIASGFAIGTVAMIPLDRHLALRLQDSSTQSNRFLKRTSTGVELITAPGAYIIGGSMYLIGKVGHFDRLADLGWHGTEAVLVAQGLTYMAKGIVGRQRPYISGGIDPDIFKLGKGFTNGDYASFPSGHTSSAFAVASLVTNETTRWWPHSTWVIGPIMYAGATTVGLSRMYHSKHWASDVVLGAAVGTFSGRKVWQYSHDHPNNALDRILLRTSVMPNSQGGFSFVTTVPVGR